MRTLDEIHFEEDNEETLDFSKELFDKILEEFSAIDAMRKEEEDWQNLLDTHLNMDIEEPYLDTTDETYEQARRLGVEPVYES